MAMALRRGPVAPVCYLAGNAQPRRLTNTNARPPNVETAAHPLRYHAPVTRRRARDATIITVMLYPRMTTPPLHEYHLLCPPTPNPEYHLLCVSHEAWHEPSHGGLISCKGITQCKESLCYSFRPLVNPLKDW
jgi:hypothetical protein